MKIRERLFELLAIRPEEGTRFSLLFVHSLLNGFYTAFLFSAANALFLDQFEISDLPWAYVATAVASLLVVRLFARFERRIDFRWLLRLNLSFLFVVAAGGCAVEFGAAEVSLGRVTVGHVVAFLLFMALIPCLKLLSLGFWGLGLRLFDLRQSKRLFSLVTSGEVVASIAGFFLVTRLVSLDERGAAVLLLLAAVFCALSFLAQESILRKLTGDLAPTRSFQSPEPGPSLRTQWGDGYFRSICGMMLVLVLAYYLVDLSFLEQVRTAADRQVTAFLPGEDSAAIQATRSQHVARYIGMFYAFTKAMELLFKTSLAGRFLSSFGIRWALLALPGLFFLALAAALTSMAKTAELMTETFFYLVLLLKLLWLVLRKSLFDPSVRVLYQPLVAESRLAFQVKVEQVSDLGAVGMALVLLFSSFLRPEGFQASTLVWLLLPAFGGWFFAARQLYRGYRRKLEENLGAEKSRQTRSSPTDLVLARIAKDPPEDLRYLVEILERLDPTKVEAVLAERVDDDLHLISRGALKRIERTRAYGTYDAVARCAETGPEPVREAARAALAALTELRGLIRQPALLDRKLSSQESRNRELAATALGFRRTGDSVEKLAVLLWDPAENVRRAAILAAGRLGHRRFWPQVVGYLSSARFSDAAYHSLILVGEPVLHELELAFRRVDQTLDVKLRIMNLYERIGGTQAWLLLRDKLEDPEKTVRSRALVMLSQGGLGDDSQPSPRLERGEVERRIREVVGTTAWNQAAVLDLGEHPAVREVREALEGEIAQNHATIFLLLSLIEDKNAIDLIRENVENDDSGTTVYALELLEEMLQDSPIRGYVAPVFEDLLPAQRLRALERALGDDFRIRRRKRIDRLHTIVQRDYARIGSWTKACAIQAVGKLSKKVPDVLVANLFHPEAMLQQLAAQSIHDLDPEDYRRHVAKLTYEEQERIHRVVGTDGAEGTMQVSSSLFERVLLLATARGFGGLDWDLLLDMAKRAEELEAEPDREVPRKIDPEGTLYVVVRGLLGPRAGAGTVLSAHGVIARRALVPRMKVVEEKTRLLRLDGVKLLDLIFQHPQLLRAVIRASQPMPSLQFGSLSTISTRHSDILAGGEL